MGVLGAGAPQVQVMNVSEDQRQAELKERQALVSGSASANTWYDISRDVSCAASSMWIFDEPGVTGNEICFYAYRDIDAGIGASSTLLAFYCRQVQCSGGRCRCAFTWDNAVGSFWAGAQPGWFVTNNGNYTFPPYLELPAGVDGATALALTAP